MMQLRFRQYVQHIKPWSMNLPKRCLRRSVWAQTLSAHPSKKVGSPQLGTRILLELCLHRIALHAYCICIH